MTKDSAQRPTTKRVREKAVALQYSDLKELPKITATGVGEIAKRIVALAKEHNVPVQEDNTLAEMLSALDAGDYISPESYRLVAEVISFLYHADREWRDEHSFVAPVMDVSTNETEPDASSQP